MTPAPVAPPPERHRSPLRPGAPPLDVGPIQRGEWLWACRADYERDLVEELAHAGPKGVSAARLATGLVRSAARPTLHGQLLDLAFARQGLPVDAIVEGGDARALGQAIARALRQPIAAARGEPHVILQVWVADSDEANRWAEHARQVEEAARAELAQLVPHLGERFVDGRESREGKDLLAQACLVTRDHAAVGLVPVGKAFSLVPGGRRRIGAPRSSPSRAAAKLLEAFEWLGRGPDPDDVCVDLGAAPGGWSTVLLDRRARVIAVDPARLAPEIARRKGLTHVQQSAFDFALTEPVDWLLCDMAWRPLEVAALLAKWGRRRAARFLVANIKLPMKKKVEYIARVREILETGGWRDLKFKQLYHDRDEVTLGAWRAL